jgi:hypothetical protein
MLPPTQRGNRRSSASKQFPTEHWAYHSTGDRTELRLWNVVSEREFFEWFSEHLLTFHRMWPYLPVRFCSACADISLFNCSCFDISRSLSHKTSLLWPAECEVRPRGYDNVLPTQGYTLCIYINSLCLISFTENAYRGENFETRLSVKFSTGITLVYVSYVGTAMLNVKVSFVFPFSVRYYNIVYLSNVSTHLPVPTFRPCVNLPPRPSYVCIAQEDNWFITTTSTYTISPALN